MGIEELFFNKLNELITLYDKVKHAILLVENFDEKQEMYVAPINQLRSALDHIFKAVSIAHEIENCDYELKEAKEHMKRAGYDALELLSGSLGSSVISKIHPYDTETLTSVFPEYYTFIKPKISEIQLIVSQLRMGRKIDCDDTFFAYFNLIKELVEINSVIDKRIPSLQEYKEKKTKERLKKQIWQYCIGPIIGFISAALIAGLTWFFT